MTAGTISSRAGARAVAAKLLGAGLGMVANIVLARVMGPEQFGLYALGFAVASIAVVVASAGMPFGAVRFLPGYIAAGDHAALRGFHRSSLAMTLAGGLTCTLLMMLIAPLLDERSLFATVLPWAALAVVPAAMVQSFVSLLQGRGRVAGPEVTQSVIRQGATLGLIGAWLILVGPLDFRLALGAAALSAALVAAVLWQHLARLDRRDPATAGRDYAGLRLWLGTGGGLLAILVLAALNERVDLLVLGWMASASDLGVYSAAARLASIAILMLAGLGAAYMPRISAAWARRDMAEIERLCREGSIAGTVLTLCLAAAGFVGGQFVLAQFGPGFEAGGTALTILLVAQVPCGMMGLAGGLAVITGNARITLAVTAAGLAANAAAAAVLVPIFGINGAAAGMLLSFTFSQVACAVWCSRRLGVRASLLPYGPRAAATRVSHA